MTFSLNKLRSDRIKDFYIIHKSGFSILHRAYITSKIDENLLSGFLTAIFTISEELSIESIDVMDMGSTKFIYERYENFIFILNVVKEVELELGRNILSKIVSEFKEIYKKTDNKIKSEENRFSTELKSIRFKLNIDSAVDEALIEYFFNSPKKLLGVISSYLNSIFGTMGINMLEESIKKVSRGKDIFKIENFSSIIDVLEESIIRKTSQNQGKEIIKQIRDTFLSQ